MGFLVGSFFVSCTGLGFASKSLPSRSIPTSFGLRNRRDSQLDFLSFHRPEFGSCHRDSTLSIGNGWYRSSIFCRIAFRFIWNSRWVTGYKLDYFYGIILEQLPDQYQCHRGGYLSYSPQIYRRRRKRHRAICHDRSQ